MIFAWNKFDVLNKSPELAKLHLATAWESVPSVLAENKGLECSDVTVYNLSLCLFGVSFLYTNKQITICSVLMGSCV